MASTVILDKLALQQAQCVDVADDQAVAEHAVPALEGDFLQRLDRRATRIALSGVLTGDQASKDLGTLRDKFRKATPVAFTADIASATSVGTVLIEAFDVRELAGKPSRFEYALGLREYAPPPAPPPNPPPIPPPPAPAVTTGTLVTTVTVDGEPDFDFSTVALTLNGTADDGTVVARTVTARAGNEWTADQLHPGTYTATAVVTTPGPMSGAATASVKAGQTAQAHITLTVSAAIAHAFVVSFRFDKAFVEPSMRAVLQRAKDYADTHPDEHLVIVGHTDKTGSDAYNLSLGDRRARAVFAFLTFGRDADGAAAEWNELRKPQASATHTIQDNWGVREYQQMLQDLGFYPGAIDGTDGPQTRSAVRAYRCHKGLPSGATVDDTVWDALIRDYMGQDGFAFPASRFLVNCPGTIIKWIGCGEQDPVRNVPFAWRPNRIVELLFVTDTALPTPTPKPETFDLPAPNGVDPNWCAGGGDPNARCALLSRTGPQKGKWQVQPADPGTVTAQGTIFREVAQPDGSTKRQPAAGARFVLISPAGEFKASEGSQGEPVPARTDASGNFSFSDMPVGVFTLEMREPTLAKLADAGDVAVTGATVHKTLLGPTDRLDVVLPAAPPLAEIALRTVAHVIRAINPRSHGVRTCPRSFGSGAPFPQATAHTDDEIRAAFSAANQIWQQARVRFDPIEIVHESYEFRVDCDVDDPEFTTLLKRDAYDGALNVFFVGSLDQTGEAGVTLSPEKAAPFGLPGGCAVADRLRLAFGGQLLDETLSADKVAQTLAHEIGHYLTLPDLTETSATAPRLMTSPSSNQQGTNRLLAPDEVTQARSGQGASDTCLPLTLTVTGATRIGSASSNQFVVVRDPAHPATVTADATIPARLLDPTQGTLTLTGGQPGANPQQVIVPTNAAGPVTVVATYTPVGGGATTTRTVVVHVTSFTLGADGASFVRGDPDLTFAFTRDPSKVITVLVNLDDPPFCVPDDFVQWTGGAATASPLRRTSPRTGDGETIRATIAGVTRKITLVHIGVDVVAQPTADAPSRTFAQPGLWDKAFDANGVINGEPENANFVGSDSQRFYLRVKDPSQKQRVVVDWSTTDVNGAVLDGHPNPSITLLETAAGSGVFVSRALMLVTDEVDRHQPTHTGLPGGVVAEFSDGNHRIRRASMRGQMKAVYAIGPTPIDQAEIPVFSRSPEMRLRVPLNIFVLRVSPAGAGCISTAPDSTLWTRDLRIARESYERLGIAIETVVPPNAPGQVVHAGADSATLIVAPAGIANLQSISDADDLKIRQAYEVTDDMIRVFYVAGLSDGDLGRSYPDGTASVRIASSFIDSQTRRPYSLAHEIGHDLQNKSANGGHYKQPADAGTHLLDAQNLERDGGTSLKEEVTASKRLWMAPDGDRFNQVLSIIASPYTRAFQ